MAYSAVIQPSPEPFLQPGTPSSTDAVTRTRVSPKVTKQDPSANADAPRSRETLRSEVALRPTRVVCSACSTKLLDDRCSGLAGPERHNDHTPSPRLDILSPDDGGRHVVAALHQDARPKVAYELEGGVL